MMATSTSTENATGTATVTLEKSYFETLLRRAQFHTAGVDYTDPIHLQSVTIPKLEHDSLVASARQYENLRRNLYRGGIAEETLAILVRDDTAVEDEPARDETSDAGILRNHRSTTTTTREFSSDQDTPRKFFNGPLQDRDVNSFRGRTHEDEYTYMPEDGFDDDDTSGLNEIQALKRPSLEKFCQRTVQLCKLPKGVTHADIVEVVRGGMLLDIYLRSQDNTASISFLQPADAENFFRHIKRYDLYIRGKRVEIRWNDRQFILPNHIANKVYIGATRNLLIRNYSPRHTEQMIRDDLEHIHNLVVIKVTFLGQNAHVSTNSVHNAMFARTCMMSRATYKGSKIDWDTDECAAALEKPQSRKENEQPKKKGASSMMNRFQLLDIDEDGSMDDENNTSGVTFDTMSSRVDALVA